MALDVVKLEERIDRVAAGGTAIDMGFGGVKFATLLELMEFAKLMAVSGSAVPAHLRGNAGTCLAICTKALRFGFDPFSLAEHSYTMIKSMKVDGQWQDVETIAYDSFVIHAIIEAHGDVTGKLRPTYEGEGDDRKCTCTGVVDGETLSVTSDTLGAIKKRIGRNDKGKLKGSPLWDTKPDQQLWYDTRRDWCRAYQPHILLGWYDKDELQEHGGDRARDVTPEKPNLKDRLKGNKDRGFSAQHVERETRGPVVDETGSHTEHSEASQQPSTAPQSPGPETPPAAEPQLAAGTLSEASEGGVQPSSEASRENGSALQASEPVGALPAGWEKDYAQALRRATKKESLSKFAKQFWELKQIQWTAIKATPDGLRADKIYDAFAHNFGNKDAIDAQLRELGVL